MDEQKQHHIMSTVVALNRYIRDHEISDFRIKGLDGEMLYLVGSFDLSYYYDVEIVIAGVVHLNLPCNFWVDLSELQPFFITFPPENNAVFNFTDCGVCQRGEIVFEEDISFSTEHISYG